MDWQADKQSFVEELVCSIDFVTIYSSLVLDVLVTPSICEVLHKIDLISLHLPLEGEVPLLVSPSGSELSSTGLLRITLKLDRPEEGRRN